MDEPPDVSCEDGTRRHLLDGRSTTRNRKVVGSNPTSGSKTAGQRRQSCVHDPAVNASVIPSIEWRSSVASGHRRWPGEGVQRRRPGQHSLEARNCSAPTGGGAIVSPSLPKDFADGERPRVGG
jgi:hypothetical protein